VIFQNQALCYLCKKLEMNPEEDLIELIGHKLKFITDPCTLLTLASIDPLQTVNDPDWKATLQHFGIAELQINAELPKTAEILIFKLPKQSIAVSLALLPELMSLPGWANCQAVLNQRVYLFDDQVYQSASELEKLEILAEVIYPKFFAFGHDGKAWLKLSL
jgi:iron complex transport system substrate-binding protein